MIKIKVTFSGPTNTRGARMIAKGGGKQKTIPYDYALNASERYLDAATTLAKALGPGMVLETWETGEFVFVPSV